MATQTSAMSTFKNMKHYVFWDFNFRFTSIRLTTFLSFNYSRNVWSFVDLSSLCHVTTQTSAMSTFKNTKHYAFWDFNFRFTSICLTTFLSFFFKNIFKFYEQLLIHLKNKNCLLDDPLTPFGPYNKLPIIKTAYNKLGTTFGPWAIVVKDQTTPFLIFLCLNPSLPRMALSLCYERRSTVPYKSLLRETWERFTGDSMMLTELAVRLKEQRKL